jgi:hypothetical protein
MSVGYSGIKTALPVGNSSSSLFDFGHWYFGRVVQREGGSIYALVSVAAYAGFEGKDHIDGAPHIKRESLRHLYATLPHEVFVRAAPSAPKPKVFD